MSSLDAEQSTADAGRTITIRQVVVAAVVLVALIFVAQNTRKTTVNVLFWNISSPLWVWLLALLAIGAVAGAFGARRRLRSRSNA